MASFHGLWSLAGFAGAALGALTLTFQTGIFYHFLLVSTLMILVLCFIYPHLSGEKQSSGSGFVLKKPDSYLFLLGIIAFCSMVCEGCMFDWSGIYFQEVVKVESGLIAAGFAAYMGMMTAGRFVSDYFTNRFGSIFIFKISGIFIFSGLMVSVLFPYFYTAVAGFMLVGAGTSSVLPLTYSEAGKSKTFSPGIALTIISTFSFFGFFIGPPLIGFIAEAANLKSSFIVISLVGLTITLLMIVVQNKTHYSLTICHIFSLYGTHYIGFLIIVFLRLFF